MWFSEKFSLLELYRMYGVHKGEFVSRKLWLLVTIGEQGFLTIHVVSKSYFILYTLLYLQLIVNSTQSWKRSLLNSQIQRNFHQYIILNVHVKMNPIFTKRFDLNLNGMVLEIIFCICSTAQIFFLQFVALEWICLDLEYCFPCLLIQFKLMRRKLKKLNFPRTCWLLTNLLGFSILPSLSANWVDILFHM